MQDFLHPSITIWVNYNNSLTWIVRPFGDDFPIETMITISIIHWLNILSLQHAGLPDHTIYWQQEIGTYGASLGDNRTVPWNDDCLGVSFVCCWDANYSNVCFISICIYIYNHLYIYTCIHIIYIYYLLDMHCKYIHSLIILIYFDSVSPFCVTFLLALHIECLKGTVSSGLMKSDTGGEDSNRDLQPRCGFVWK